MGVEGREVKLGLNLLFSPLSNERTMLTLEPLIAPSRLQWLGCYCGCVHSWVCSFMIAFLRVCEHACARACFFARAPPPFRKHVESFRMHQSMSSLGAESKTYGLQTFVSSTNIQFVAQLSRLAKIRFELFYFLTENWAKCSARLNLLRRNHRKVNDCHLMCGRRESCAGSSGYNRWKRGTIV